MRMKDFESTTHIEMRVRSAEHQIHSFTTEESLLIKFSLITIARGSCEMWIKPSSAKSGFSGTLNVPLDRNVMEARINLPQKHFNYLVKQMIKTAGRSVTATIELGTTLTLGRDGCLIIDEPTATSITSLNWTLALK